MTQPKNNHRNHKQGWSLLELLGAMVIVGFGILLFLKVQNMSQRMTSGNTKLLKAGHLVEKQIEDLRIEIAKNPATNFPSNALNVTILSPTAPDNIKIVRTIRDALSPKDKAIVTDVKCVVLVASWGLNSMDTLQIMTYVSRNF